MPLTLSQLLTALDDLPSDLPAVFITQESKIGGGYHVTELKRAAIIGADCGGRTWDETELRLQLLDGFGDAHMATGKLTSILRRAGGMMLNTETDTPLIVEFSPRNEGLQLWRVAAVVIEGAEAQLRLTPHGAACRPMQDWSASCCASAACCA